MKTILCTLAVVLTLSLASTTFAAQPKTYQVTGPVVEITDDKIVVEKDGEKWEVGRDKDTKVDGDLKVGAKVTVTYRMWAGKVEVKK